MPNSSNWTEFSERTTTITTKDAIDILERRAEFLAQRIANEDTSRPPNHRDRAEHSALRFALEHLRCAQLEIENRRRA